MRTDTLSVRFALRTLLTLQGMDTTGFDILQSMEAPYLFLRRNGRYLAGSAFFCPEGLVLYLRPKGLQLTEHQLTHKSLRPLLKRQSPLLLLPKDQALLIIRYEENRVTLYEASAAPEKQTITFPTLLRKLPESFCALALDACPPEDVPLIPLLCESVRTLADYRRELTAARALTVTREDMRILHPLFRPLMVDLPQIAHLYPDPDLAQLLIELANIYRHLFIIGEREVQLRDRLPLGMMNRATLWLQELIIDRLYELGAPDNMLEPLYAYLRI